VNEFWPTLVQIYSLICIIFFPLIFYTSNQTYSKSSIERSILKWVMLTSALNAHDKLPKNRNVAFNDKKINS
jgi:hypothetical protein